MMNSGGLDKRNASPKSRGLQHLVKKKMLPFVGVLAVVVVVVVVLLIVSLFDGVKPTRTESYKDVSGAAGLDASITYDCKDNCEQKYNFNVYILGGDGQQVAVVRPDKDGKVQLALPEGNYVVLIGKQFGKDKVFPQEPLALKNGKALELKLHYR